MLAAVPCGADAEAAEALALALHLDDLDPAALTGGGDVGPAVRLLVQAHDVDDPDLLDLGRHQVRRGADDVGQAQRSANSQRSTHDTADGVHGADGAPGSVEMPAAARQVCHHDGEQRADQSRPYAVQHLHTN